MPQVVPVHLELALVVHMNKFVDNGALHVRFVYEPVLAQGYGAGCGHEATGALLLRAGQADQMLWGDVTATGFEMLDHEDDGRAWGVGVRAESVPYERVTRPTNTDCS